MNPARDSVPVFKPRARAHGLDSLAVRIRLGELLMLRAQLQKDVEEHALRVTSNAVREVGDPDPPSYDPVEALKGGPVSCFATACSTLPSVHLQCGRASSGS